MKKFVIVLTVVGVVGIGASCRKQQSEPVPEPVAPAVEQAPVEQAPVEQASVDIQGTAWVAEEIGGKGVIGDPQSTLIFFEDGEVSGSGACNRYMATFQIEGDRIAIAHLSTTKMACPEAVMDQENRFLLALAQAERIELTDDGFLVLYPTEGEPTRMSLMPGD
jgi:heat shock protein HslJ